MTNLNHIFVGQQFISRLPMPPRGDHPRALVMAEADGWLMVQVSGEATPRTLAAGRFFDVFEPMYEYKQSGSGGANNPRGRNGLSRENTEQPMR